MKENKQKFFSILLIGVCVLFIVMFIIFDNKTESQTINNASSYEEIVIGVNFEDTTQMIKIWNNAADNVFYCFLPSGSDLSGLCFANIADDDMIYLDDIGYKKQENIAVECEKEYCMNFISNGQTLGMQKLVFLKSEHIPSMFIDTESGSTAMIDADKAYKEKAEITLLNNEGLCEYSNEIEYIKARGNSTFKLYDKKPYQIKLLHEESLLGMPEAKKWILLANVVDDSLIRNELVFRYTENYTSVPSIKGQYIDLYLNGEYVGNYYLCEKIEIDEKRLNITDLEEQTKEVNIHYDNAQFCQDETEQIKAYSGMINPADITGGYIVECTLDVDTMAQNSFVTNGGKCFSITSPEKATVEQAEYICNLFNEFELAVQQEDGINPITGKHFSEYIDIDSWATKYVIEEVFADPDATILSMYFYKDADCIDSRIHCGPVWDYDRAIGDYGINSYVSDNPEQEAKYGIYVDEMMKHEEVRALVYEKFEKEMVPYVEYVVSADVYHMYTLLEPSHKMDEIRWPENYGYYTDFKASNDYLIDFLNKKVTYLKSKWLNGEEYCDVVFLDYNGNVYCSYSVKRGDTLGFEPQIASWGAVFNGWYTVDEGTIFEPRLPVYQDVTYSANWIPIDLMLQNGLQIADMDVSQVNPDVIRALAEIIEQQSSEQSDEE